MHNETLQAKLIEVFGAADAGKVIGFLEKGRFSEGGEAAIVKIFLGAKTYGKTVTETILACNQEWPENWRTQSVAIRGDPGAFGNVGKANQDAIARINAALGISTIVAPGGNTPLSVKGDEIPKGPFLAMTKKYVSRFGPVDEKGRRLFERNGGEKLPGSTCIEIVSLMLGEPMEIRILTRGGSVWRYRDTEVVSVTPVEPVSA